MPLGARLIAAGIASLVIAIAIAFATSTTASAQAAVTLSGLVTDAGGNRLAGVNVSVYQGGSGAACCTWITARNTEGDGRYSLSLAPGTYRLQFHPPASSNAVGRWWTFTGTARVFDHAADIALTTDQTLGDVALESGIVVSGTVGRVGGGALSNVNVSAYANGTTWVAGTRTDGGGNYSFRVPSGSYRVQFTSPADTGLIAQWWDGTADGAPTFDDAADVPPGGSTNALLATGRAITGRVTDGAGAGIGGAGAQLFVGGDDASSRAWVTGSRTDAAGYYTTIVPDGTYRLQFTAPRGSRYLDEWHDGGSGATYLEDATDVTVSGPHTFNATLATGQRISGRITDGVNGIAGASASAFEGGADAVCCEWMASAGTDSDGAFSLVVPSGVYRVMFQGPSGSSYTAQWWTGAAGGATFFGSAIDINVTAADDSDTNAALGTGIRISGHVRFGSTPIARVGVAAFEGGPGASCCDWVGGVGTGTDGSYDLVLPAGTYRIYYVAPPSSSLVSTWWGDEGTEFDLADDVTLSTPISGRDVALGGGVVLSGRVSSATSGIAGAFVSAFRGGSGAVCCAWVAGAPTDGVGDYELALLPGTYRLQFGPPPGTSLIPRWSGGAAVFDSASDVAVSVSAAPTVNMTLPAGYLISGRVIDGTNGIPFVGVGIFQGGSSATCCKWLGGGSTDASGAYSIAVEAGTYRVQFSPQRGASFMGEWHNGSTGAARFDLATDVVVSANAALGDATLSAALHVTGRVTGPDGNGVGNVGVSGFTGGSSATCCTWVAGTATDAGGYYSLAVTSGTYRLQVFPSPSGSLVGQWWKNVAGGARDFDAAEDIVLSTNAAGKNFQLSAGVRISGSVTVQGTSTGIANAHVDVMDCAGSPCDWIAGANTDPTGAYSLVVPTGGYKLQFSAPSYVPEWWNDTYDVTGAATVNVPIGSPSLTYSAGLAYGASLGGTVRTTAGTGIEGINVAAFTCSGSDCTWIAGGQTNSGGVYSLLVPVGSYKVQFTGSAGSRYISEWYSDKSTSGTADTVSVPSAGVTGIDAALTSGFFITGTVSGTGGGLANAHVDALDCSTDPCTVVSTATTIDTAGQVGSFSLLVPAGTYKLQFRGPDGSLYLAEYWSDQALLVNAADVQVSGDSSGFLVTLAP